MITAFRRRITTLRAEPEGGFGMAELAIYAALSVVILTIVASLFKSSLDTRTQVTDMSTAAGVGQLIATSVAEGVRNANGPLGATDDDRRRDELANARGSRHVSDLGACV